MTNFLIEDPRTTLYRRRLAELLRRPSCRWISFAIGTAVIHRNFFESVAVAIEGLRAGGVQHQVGTNHRQVQYGVRLRIGASDLHRARYDADRDHFLTVPAEGAFDTLETQATLVSACVHLGLDLDARHHHRLDSECAALIARHLYRLYETIAVDESAAELVEKQRQLAPASPADRLCFDVATEIVLHCRATVHANRRSCPLRPGTFMKIVGTGRRERVHSLLLDGSLRCDRSLCRPAPGAASRASRFLALQALELADVGYSTPQG